MLLLAQLLNITQEIVYPTWGNREIGILHSVIRGTHVVYWHGKL